MKIAHLINRDLVVEIISALFILLFAYTALSKLMDMPNFITTLWTMPEIREKSSLIGWSIPITELVLCILLYFPRTRLPGLYGALILMSIFTIFIGYMLLFSSKLPCHCGGVISQMTWGQHLIFNTVFIGLAWWGIRILKRKQRTDHSLSDYRTAYV